MTAASNKAYLEKLARQLVPVPSRLASRVGFHIFLEMLDVSTSTAFDSGQAAANWRIEGYLVNPKMLPQMMLWGHGFEDPIEPVGYKAWYADFGSTGDPEQVYEHQYGYAVSQVTNLPLDITGVVVYNPIRPGFSGFTPGDDAKYEANALSANKSSFDSSIAAALAKGSAEVRAEFPFLRNK